MSGSPPSQMTIPNPLNPLALLPPSIADQFEASRYLYLATTGAFIWDILTTLGQDYRLLFRYKITLPTVVYFVSRISSLAFVLTALIFQTAPVGDCQALLYAFGVCYVVSLTSTSCLFFLRARAVLASHRYLVWFFTFLWIVNSGLAIEVPFSLTGMHIGPTTRCVNSNIKNFASATLIVSSTHDTLIYLAISWKIITGSRVDHKNDLQSHLNGRGLQGLSKLILQGNQIYFVVTIVGNVVCTVLLLTTSVPPIIRAMFNVPNLALENAMATRIFRSVKLQGPERMGIGNSTGTMQNHHHTTVLPRHRGDIMSQHAGGGDNGTYMLGKMSGGAKPDYTGHGGIHVKREVIATSESDIPLKTMKTSGEAF